MRTLLQILSLLLVLSTVSPYAMAQKKKSSTKAKTTTTTQQKKSTSKKSTSTKQAAPDVNSLKKQRDAAQTKIKQSQAQLEKNKREVKKQLGALAVVNAQIEEHERTINLVKGRLDSVNTNINNLEQKLVTLDKELKDCKLKYARSMLYLYKNRRTSNKLMFLLSAKDFRQMGRRYTYVKEYSKYQRTAGEIVKRKQEEIEAAKLKLDAEKQSHTNLLVQEQNENAKLNAKKTEQQTTVDALQKKQKEIQSVIATSQKEMAKLNQQIDYYVKLAIEQERKRKLEAERKRKAEEERKAREAEQKRLAAERKAAADKAAAERAAASSKTSTTTSKSTPEPAKATPAPAKSTPAPAASTPKAEPKPKYEPNNTEYTLTSNFAANKGRLPMPITGSYLISTHFGNYTMKGVNVQLNSKGINLTGNPGAQARCIYDGEVVAVFTTSGLKNLMVRHGSYISVYCNLSSVSVSQGQSVKARQSLGSVANDASGKPNLYFQLQKESATLNPESWLAR